MKKKWMIVLLIVIAVASGGGYFWYQKSHAPQKDNYTVGAVSRGTIGLTIDATGTIEPVNSVDLSATASGTLEKVYVKQNEKVTKGETLAMIESKALTSMMKQTQNTLANKESYYERLAGLYEKGAIPYQEMDNARMDYLNAQAAYDKAQADVNDTVITSPMDGVVIGEPMKEGETVSQGLSSQMVIVTVADLSSMRIELLVDETDIGEVAVGEGVEFTVDAYPNRTFHGVVSDISKKQYSASGSTSSSSSSVVYYTVYVDINKDELEGLYPSMTARAVIKGRESVDALTVPVTAIRSDSEGSYVYVKEGADVKKTYVTTGISTEKEIEVTSGLSEGQEIVVSGTVSQEKTSTPIRTIATAREVRCDGEEREIGCSHPLDGYRQELLYREAGGACPDEDRSYDLQGGVCLYHGALGRWEIDVDEHPRLSRSSESRLLQARWGRGREARGQCAGLYQKSQDRFRLPKL